MDQKKSRISSPLITDFCFPSYFIFINIKQQRIWLKSRFLVGKICQNLNPTPEKSKKGRNFNIFGTKLCQKTPISGYNLTFHDSETKCASFGGIGGCFIT
jgi:hypothetical protein